MITMLHYLTENDDDESLGIDELPRGSLLVGRVLCWERRCDAAKVCDAHVIAPNARCAVRMRSGVKNWSLRKFGRPSMNLAKSLGPFIPMTSWTVSSADSASVSDAWGPRRTLVRERGHGWPFAS